ncbi:FG-GAP repeat domain-containing protein [Nannocystis pusilla]|uniref:FG-GAP repeat domain-containing protein n=1 Tax=Nannocystis pusilla TaxID=889268 RepID=UPI003B8399A1
MVRHQPRVAVDFDHDGRSDLALTGASAWRAVPMAFAAGRSFKETDLADPNLAAAAAREGVQIATGDFDGDGRTDVVLSGAPD